VSHYIKELTEKAFIVHSTLVHNKGGDFPARLFTHRGHLRLAARGVKSVRSQRFVIAVIAGLTHPGFEVADPNFRIPARVPYQVVPVAPLQARLPLPANDRMEPFLTYEPPTVIMESGSSRQGIETGHGFTAGGPIMLWL
jgi:hypothetical protein